ncbi:winged helix-turn-helix domain-containing protein [Pantoea sp. FN060301]|uniref:winged helix-turn-helix domain-containing protein n=1 Tax=Pantoea sp. FN060301 TaxID=3420380 RepID=UPI003D1629EA
MNYIIDDSIAYNSEDCTLTHIPTQESLSLSISSGRLFELLLKSGGEILNRDVLLTEVWDKYGLRGSNSNLNQYLSMLRRALAAYGCENLIVTIPKIGIRLNTEIKIEQVPGTPALATEEVPREAAATENSQPLPQPEEKASGNAPRLNSRFFSLFVLAMLLAGAGGYYLFISFTEREMPASTIELAGGCEVVLLEGLAVAERPSVDKQILQMLRENHQTCDSAHRIYFGNYTSFTPQNYGRTMLSSCKLNSGGHVISCDNFYYLDWRMD